MKELNLPKLGFGFMRLPKKDGKIDMVQTKEMVDDYMNKGFNYFDTAYVYGDGESEKALREAVVERYPRDSFFLADKLPEWQLKKPEDRDALLEESMRRLGVDYIDFYLIHAVEEGSHYQISEDFDLYNWGQAKKQEGKIGNFGFSFHGTPELLERILDDHPDVDFVQIQLNYLDWDSDIVESRRIYEILKERGIPILVMEPVKGGILADPLPEMRAILEERCPGSTPASLALRFAASLDGVAVVLSGMSDLAQLSENIDTFDGFKPIDENERKALEAVVEKMKELDTIECTACSYCTSGCPAHINIPEIFKALNSRRIYPKDDRPKTFYNRLILTSGKAGDCIECAQCEGVCPQHLPIPELLREASEIFDK